MKNYEGDIIYNHINYKKKIWGMPFWMVFIYAPFCIIILFLSVSNIAAYGLLYVGGFILIIPFIVWYIGESKGERIYDSIISIIMTYPMLSIFTKHKYIHYVKNVSIPYYRKTIKKSLNGIIFIRNKLTTTNYIYGSILLSMASIKKGNKHYLDYSKLRRLFNIYKNPKGLLTKYKLKNLPYNGIFYDEVHDVCFVLNDDLSLSVVLSLEGMDYEGMDYNKINNIYESRSNIIKNYIEKNIKLSLYTYRCKKYIEDKNNNDLSLIINANLDYPPKGSYLNYKETPYYQEAYTKYIDDSWRSTFNYYFEHQHYIVITIDKTRLYKNSIEKLSEIKNKFISGFKEYKCEMLDSGKTSGFLMKIMYGYDDIVLSNSGIDPNMLSHLENYNIDIKKGIIEFPSRENDKYAACIEILKLGDKLPKNLMSNILSLPYKILWSSHTHLLSPKKINTLIHRNIGFKRFFDRDAFTGLSENNLKIYGQKIDSGDIIPINSRFLLMVYENDKNSLLDAISEIKNMFDTKGYKTDHSKLLLNSYYHSLWTSRARRNPYNYIINTDNLVNMFQFSNPNKGGTKNSWGNNPLQLFYTSSTHSIYNFNLHETEDKDSKAHTLIVGGSGSGKTTLALFLVLSALKYKDIKIRLFDSLKGMKIFTEFTRGRYIGFDGSNRFNPFRINFNDSKEQMISDVKNMSDFLCIALEANNKEKNHIKDILNRWFLKNDKMKEYKGSIDLRFIRAIMKKVVPELGDVSKRIDDMINDELYKNIFIPETNTREIMFDEQLLTFDVTNIKNDPLLLSLVTKCIMHEINKDVNPGLIFIDELSTYLESKEFRENIVFLLSQARKKNKAIVTAVQDISQIVRYEKTYKSMFANYARVIFLPRINAEKKEKEFLKDVFKLNNAELEWITVYGGNRQFMVKNITHGDSVILDGDISGLGKGIMASFSSSQEKVRFFEIIQKLVMNKYDDIDNADDEILHFYFNYFKHFDNFKNSKIISDIDKIEKMLDKHIKYIKSTS